MDQYPPIDLVLLTRLEEQFKDRSPDRNDTDRQIMFAAGQVDVVRFLRGQFDFQNETQLQPEA